MNGPELLYMKIWPPKSPQSSVQFSYFKIPQHRDKPEIK